MEFTPSNTSPLWEDAHLSKDALVRWRNHTLSPAQVVEASEHLAVCAQCRDQLAAPPSLLFLAQALDSGGDALALLREPELQHLNFEQMEAFVDELLTPAGRRNVERHLARCEVCSSQVADLRAVQSDLRDWQLSSQSATEALRAKSTTANGAVPHRVAAPELEKAPTFVAPPMRVALPSATEETSRRRWWDVLRNMQRYLLPLETAGVAATAVFLLLSVPARQEIARQKELVNVALNSGQNQSQQSDAQIKQLRDSVASLSKQSGTTQQKVRQLAKDKAALASQFGDAQSQLSAAQLKLEAAQSQLSALEEQRRRDRERFTGRPSATSPAVAPRPTSSPQGAAPSPNFGVQISPDDAVRVLSQALQAPASIKALRVLAPSSKSGDAQLRFRLLSPVATRVREVLPLLRWQAVPGANVYRVTLDDETDSQASPPKSDLLTQPQWQPEEPLIRGHRYSWKVEAWKQDQSSGKRRLLGDAPHKPDLAANFELLTQTQEDALRARLAAVKDSPLEKSIALAREGVMDEAQQQLSLVIRPKAPSSP